MAGTLIISFTFILSKSSSPSSEVIVPPLASLSANILAVSLTEASCEMAITPQVMTSLTFRFSIFITPSILIDMGYNYTRLGRFVKIKARAPSYTTNY